MGGVGWGGAGVGAGTRAGARAGAWGRGMGWGSHRGKSRGLGRGRVVGVIGVMKVGGECREGCGGGECGAGRKFQAPGLCKFL